MGLCGRSAEDGGISASSLLLRRELMVFLFPIKALGGKRRSDGREQGREWDAKTLQSQSGSQVRVQAKSGRKSLEKARRQRNEERGILLFPEMVQKSE